ncbi:uncharacterized protein LOC129601497 [Paramacrobiotus metropolitanus]|uniref:uncharacterized protein LOC129601497 n=1 Tax=Paramacrobiotus metropolitanus TaxID=2943436 RepID=UPI0024458332|nr:uncharacterized protein LOC129601497 [Paramacrobiotus metropolitanus]
MGVRALIFGLLLLTFTAATNGGGFFSKQQPKSDDYVLLITNDLVESISLRFRTTSGIRLAHVYELQYLSAPFHGILFRFQKGNMKKLATTVKQELPNISKRDPTQHTFINLKVPKIPSKLSKHLPNLLDIVEKANEKWSQDSEKVFISYDSFYGRSAPNTIVLSSAPRKFSRGLRGRKASPKGRHPKYRETRHYKLSSLSDSQP